MYDLIIVDDEKLVRENIRHCMDWEAQGFRFRGAYANGEEAVEAIERDRPHVVLSDICMPFMDGLQLCAYLHQNHPSIKVILLTGFDDFGYAQQALRMKAYDYILKPITARELRGLLDKVKSDMDEERSRHRQLATMRMQLNQSLPLLMEKSLDEMISTPMPAKERNERLRDFRLPELHGHVIAMIVDLDDYGSRESDLTSYDQGLLRYASFNIATELSSRRDGITFRNKEEKIVVLLACDRGETVEAAAESLADEIREVVSRQLQLTVTVGVGSAFKDAADLPLAYKTACHSLSYRLLLGLDRTIAYREIARRGDSEFTGADWGRKLSACIKTETDENMRLLLADMIGQLKDSSMTIEACHRSLLQLLTAVMDVLRELGGKPAFPENETDPFQRLYQWKTLDQVGKWLEKLCEGAIGMAAEQRSQLVNGGMISAAEYIEQHFNQEDLSLQAVCKHVMMSPSYFSSSFKQYTGETFVEYLTRIRMQKAKEYLLRSNLRSYEIAYKVGYKDHNYFSAVFKKQTGQSPTEFREHRLRSCKHEA